MCTYLMTLPFTPASHVYLLDDTTFHSSVDTETRIATLRQIGWQPMQPVILTSENLNAAQGPACTAAAEMRQTIALQHHRVSMRAHPWPYPSKHPLQAGSMACPRTRDFKLPGNAGASRQQQAAHHSDTCLRQLDQMLLSRRCRAWACQDCQGD